MVASINIETMQRDARPSIDTVSHWSDGCDGDLDIKIALPGSYGKRKKAFYPLLIVLDSSGFGNAAIDISRLMANTQEVMETIVVTVKLGRHSLFPAVAPRTELLPSHDRLVEILSKELQPWLEQTYRVKTGEFALFSHSDGCALLLDILLSPNNSADHFIFSAPLCSSEFTALLESVTNDNAALSAVKTVLCIAPEVNGAVVTDENHSADSFGTLLQPLLSARVKVQERHVPDTDLYSIVEAALCLCLRTRWATGRKYGAGVEILAKKWVYGFARFLIPLARHVQPKVNVIENHPTAEIVYAEALQRNFEISLSLPRDYHTDDGKRYPMLVVLDGNYAFGIVAETARRLAAAGKLEDLIVLGVGVNQAEGAKTFELRRLVEFSPKAPGYLCDDSLGRSLSSMFALYGRDLRQEFGRAADTYHFLTEQLLPQIVSTLAVNQNDIGLLGHSAGGTFVGYCLRQPSSPFKRFVCSSPGVAISDSWLMKPENINPLQRPWQTDVALSIGSEEYDNAFNIVAGIPRTPEYAKALALDPSLNVSCIDVPGETHSTAFFHIVPRALMQFWAKS